MNESQQLLADYLAGSEDAFREFVTRYINLVYGTALRLVDGDAHLAEDVSQRVFADVARKAARLSPQIQLGGWLHRHTCFVAAATMRAERRRRRREREAMETNALDDHSEANLARLLPVLDEAVNELAADDRTAVILRFFERRDFRAIGAEIGSNEEAARKRVHRALDKLHRLLARRGVALPASVLATALMTGVGTAAPAGLAASVSTVAISGASSTGTTITLLEFMSMAKVKTAVVCAIIAAGVAVPVVKQQREKTRLQAQTAAMQREMSVLNEEIDALARRPVPVDAAPPASSADLTRELMKLRGEVGRLRTENAAINAASAARTNAAHPLDALLADPAMQATLLEQQRMAIKATYTDFTNRVHLTSAQRDKLIELLTGTFIENLRAGATLVRDGRMTPEAEALFAQRDAALRQQVQALLGRDGLAQYDEYTRNLTTHFTVQEFADKLGGSSAEQETKGRRLREAMQQETTQVLANAGLSADYQLLPRLNFRNLISDEEAERALHVLDTIYAGVTARASEFLEAEEVAKFAEFRTNAITANRLALLTARKVMASAK